MKEWLKCGAWHLSKAEITAVHDLSTAQGARVGIYLHSDAPMHVRTGHGDPPFVLREPDMISVGEEAKALLRWFDKYSEDVMGGAREALTGVG